MMNVCDFNYATTRQVRAKDTRTSDEIRVKVGEVDDKKEGHETTAAH